MVSIDALDMDLAIANGTGWMTDRLIGVSFDALIEGDSICIIGVLLGLIASVVLVSTPYAINLWSDSMVDAVVVPGIAVKMLVGVKTDT